MLLIWKRLLRAVASERLHVPALVKAGLPLPRLKDEGLIATLKIARRIVFATPVEGGAVVRVQRPLA